jgi:hypothetical protein
MKRGDGLSIATSFAGPAEAAPHSEEADANRPAGALPFGMQYCLPKAQGTCP